ncbi:MAG: hypothetical protein JXX14_17325 [Deltaproteobacteria bacterium]|nr:hypothetical protein [Deltaproteobacteria bacterium]
MTTDITYIDKLYDTALKHAQSGALSQAKTVLTQILELSPAHLKSLDLMGYVQYFLKKPQESIRYCEEALRIKPNHAYALKGLGISQAACGQIDEGVTNLKKAISVSPKYFDPHWDLAVTLARAGRTEDAVSQIETAISAFPEQKDRLLFLKSKIESGLAG